MQMGVSEDGGQESVDAPFVPGARATYTPFVAAGPLWWRIKLGVSLLLTPLTVVLLGRSIRVEQPKEGNGS